MIKIKTVSVLHMHTGAERFAQFASFAKKHNKAL